MQRSRLRLIILLLFIFATYAFHQRFAYWFNTGSQPYPIPQYYSEDEYANDYLPVEVEEAMNPPYEEDLPPVQPILPPVDMPHLCQPSECSAGKWIPRKNPFTSLNDVQTTYSNLWHPVWAGCDVIWDSEGNLLEEGSEKKKKLEGQRLVDTLNWEWVPDRGVLLEYDAIEFVVRLLKSPGGLVLIGDSITRQHWHAIYYTFRHLNITFDSNPKHLPLAGVPNVEQFVLSASSPMTPILQAKAGVPQSRMTRPFFTLLEDHMGLGEPDIREITNAKPDYTWFHRFRRVEGWEDHLKWLAMPREGEETSVTEDTLVMINAGAHVRSTDFCR